MLRSATPQTAVTSCRPGARAGSCSLRQNTLSFRDTPERVSLIVSLVGLGKGNRRVSGKREGFMNDREQARQAFRALHERGCFVMPNPWDVGSARYLQQLGF